MIPLIRKTILPVILLTVSSFVHSQNPTLDDVDTNLLKKFTIPLNRQLYNDYVDAEQVNILNFDGKADGQLTLSRDVEVNRILTQAATQKIDWLQYKIEKDTLLAHSGKVRYVQGLKTLLQNLLKGWRYRQLNPLHLPDCINSYYACILLDEKNQRIDSYTETLDYDIAYPIIHSKTFDDNAGIKDAQNNLVLKYCRLYPSRIYSTLQQNPDVPFADSIIRAIAKKDPRQLYDFASGNDKLSNIISNIRDDKFISSVAWMAHSRSGQQYFPFLDEIVSGKITRNQIDSVKDDSLLYYRLLVKTQIDYVRRAQNGDTAFEFESLTYKLMKRAKESFVNIINGLHTEPAEVRFKSIQPLTAEELYYLAVLTDGTIYTSSFVKGVFPLMMQRINNRGDSLLMAVHFDKYRKLIKMAAGYNTLGDFLKTFPGNDANMLMHAFVNRLEKSAGYEEAVDVADSYASIAETEKPIAENILQYINDNYVHNEKTGDKKGTVIYHILQKLFLSADSTQKIDLTKELGIPPVYGVPYRSLLNDSGQVVMQVFFYGDKDGQGIFKGFIDMFSNANWKILSNDKWVTVISKKGRPVIIYANKPLPEEGGEDEQAQKALVSFLDSSHLYPVVTVHRGHSYTAPSTIEQMCDSSKIVFMGSCGGYLIINDVLKKSPLAHIIATKQIGATEVNRPFIQLLTDKLRNGNNIDWIPFWDELHKMVQAKEFEDYIPPYKNLGALFIKAYNLAMADPEQ
jgi:hypothetical protein